MLDYQQLSLNQEHIEHVAEQMLKVLAKGDFRWTILLNDPQRSGRRMFKALWNKVRNKIQEVSGQLPPPSKQDQELSQISSLTPMSHVTSNMNTPQKQDESGFSPY